MPIEEDVEAFMLWATKLGFSRTDLPNEDSIKSIFKSRQRDLFHNLMKRVRPRQEVAEIRENILIKKLEKVNHQVVPACSRSFLPKELQNFLLIKELNAKRSQFEVRIEAHKKEFDALQASIKIKNMQHLKLEHKHEVLQARVNIFDLKSAALDKHMEQEQENKKRLLATMPVKLSARNACETAATNAVNEALNELDAFYNVFVSNQNQHVLNEAKDRLWQNLRTIVANLPNYMFFNAILRLKEAQLQNIMLLNRAHNNDFTSSGRTHTLTNSSNSARSVPMGSMRRDPFTPFELKLMKSKAELLGIVAKYLAAQQEHALLEERFTNAYPQFVDELQRKVHLFNGDAAGEHADDIISDFIVQYNFRNHRKSQNEFLAEQIEFYKAHLETGARQLEDHEVLLGSIKQVYNDISNSINRTQYEVLQLNQIREKILYAKNMLQHMLSDLQQSSNATTSNLLLPSKLKLSGNNSVMCAESFESSDCVFSSTKLDFNATLTSLNNTTTGLRRSFSASASDKLRYALAPHLLELSTFAKMPLEHFSCMSRECALYLSPNPIVMATRELSSTVQLAPGSLLTPHGALQEVRRRIHWAESIKEMSADLKTDLNLTIVDLQTFKLKSKDQRDQIAEILDKIDVADNSAKSTLQKVAKLYDFILENPLRHHIPSSKSFNNQTYADYESEFNMYYRMATVGASIK